MYVTVSCLLALCICFLRSLGDENFPAFWELVSDWDDSAMFLDDLDSDEVGLNGCLGNDLSECCWAFCRNLSSNDDDNDDDEVW